CPLLFDTSVSLHRLVEAFTVARRPDAGDRGQTDQSLTCSRAKSFQKRTSRIGLPVVDFLRFGSVVATFNPATAARHSTQSTAAAAVTRMFVNFSSWFSFHFCYADKTIIKFAVLSAFLLRSYFLFAIRECKRRH